MFTSVKGFKKEDLIYLCQEINEDLPLKVTISTLKDVILNSKEYKNDPDFVSTVLATTVSERQKKEERKRQEEEIE
ncbi:hypothetical protein TNCT_396851 [Trichonephila clavata]|uniref:Uncharacterized protein n=1 Tax=Trichonephila clavata TaxID=2740835 RepID=A0A8X6FPU7_TRICU|nr:hypothetical protein TNCT_396851 [Trichonephila clavata]